MQAKKSPAKSTGKEEPSRDELSMPEVLQALSDEIRLDIVRQIAQKGEKACGTFGIDVPKSTLSHHFRVLREAGVVTVRRKGKELMNALRTEDLNTRFPGLLRAVVGSK